jgi:hypothetical protein
VFTNDDTLSTLTWRVFVPEASGFSMLWNMINVLEITCTTANDTPLPFWNGDLSMIVVGRPASNVLS